MFFLLVLLCFFVLASLRCWIAFGFPLTLVSLCLLVCVWLSVGLPLVLGWFPFGVLVLFLVWLVSLLFVF